MCLAPAGGPGYCPAAPRHYRCQGGTDVQTDIQWSKDCLEAAQRGSLMISTNPASVYSSQHDELRYKLPIVAGA